MTQAEFIVKYKDTFVTFKEVYKYRVTYENKEHKFAVFGNISNSSCLIEAETVMSIYEETDNFNFVFRP